MKTILPFLIIASFVITGCGKKNEKKDKKHSSDVVKFEKKKKKHKRIKENKPEKKEKIAKTEDKKPVEGPIIKGALETNCDKAAKLFVDTQEKVSGNGKIEGTKFLVKCPAGCTKGTVWGTDFYTGDSGVCPAMIHAGIITADKGGYALVTFAKGLPAYRGSKRNGIKSEAYGNWGLTFFIQSVDEKGNAKGPTPVLPPEGTILADCSQSSEISTELSTIGKSLIWDCPVNCTPGSVWGTNDYTADSNVCTAAVHAGLIKVDKGGRFKVTYIKGKKNYKGSTKNGITSQSYEKYEKSYTLEKLP
ncbi:hypothetical protein KKF34_01665 [Myxococcota bacterium]|nr:hypothetical protein [Myxococcota bacterium]MBU1382064.1 hypothetical protein [Myxococcota bacterium]MBU1495566.1 hypothetical protein [Myxococcota bacterium]